MLSRGTVAMRIHSADLDTKWGLMSGHGWHDAALAGGDELDQFANLRQIGDGLADFVEGGGHHPMVVKTMVGGANGANGSGGQFGALAAAGVVRLEAAVAHGGEGRDVLAGGFVAGNDRQATDA